MKARILVVDGEESVRKSAKARLERDGYDVVTAGSTDEAEKYLGHGGTIGVVVTDSLAVLDAAKKHDGVIRVIYTAIQSQKESAIKAFKHGASDFFEKPLDHDAIAHAVKSAYRTFETESEKRDVVSRLEARVERVEGQAEDKFWFVSQSQAMARVNETLTSLKRDSMRGGGEEPSVLILGESGTGKEGVARMIHSASRRGKGPWVTVSCAGFSEQMLDSELFGHERGAFAGATGMKRGVFEIARGGTIFLDEVGDMDTKLQGKLMRAIQEKVFRRVGGTVDFDADVRVIAATSHDLGDRVRDAGFREDLFKRITQVVIDLPSLRDRKEDIVPMATQFSERCFAARSKSFGGFAPDAQEALRGYEWPGNARELLNVIERVALVFQGTGPLTQKVLSIPVNPSGKTPGGVSRLSLVSSPSMDDAAGGSYTDLKRQWSESFEREYLIATLAKHKGNVSAAAREAKIDRSNFLRLLRKHQLKAQEYRRVAA